MALAWKDKKQVNMLSTFHRGDEIVNLPQNRRGEVRRKPGCVVDYNVVMKGVDLSDQVAQSYPAARKTNKWYVKLWYNLLDMAIINAHAIHKFLGGETPQLDFRLDLISQLLQRPSGTTAPPRTRSRSRSPSLACSRSSLHPAPRANPTAHPVPRPVPRPAIRGNAPPSHILVAIGKYRRCRHCREARNRRTMSKLKCQRATCFSDYHH